MVHSKIHSISFFIALGLVSIVGCGSSDHSTDSKGTNTELEQGTQTDTEAVEIGTGTSTPASDVSPDGGEEGDVEEGDVEESDVEEGDDKEESPVVVRGRKHFEPNDSLGRGCIPTPESATLTSKGRRHAPIVDDTAAGLPSGHHAVSGRRHAPIVDETAAGLPSSHQSATGRRHFGAKDALGVGLNPVNDEQSATGRRHFGAKDALGVGLNPVNDEPVRVRTSRGPQAHLGSDFVPTREEAVAAGRRHAPVVAADAAGLPSDHETKSRKSQAPQDNLALGSVSVETSDYRPHCKQVQGPQDHLTINGEPTEGAAPARPTGRARVAGFDTNASSLTFGEAGLTEAHRVRRDPNATIEGVQDDEHPLDEATQAFANGLRQ